MSQMLDKSTHDFFQKQFKITVIRITTYLSLNNKKHGKHRA